MNAYQKEKPKAEIETKKMICERCKRDRHKYVKGLCNSCYIMKTRDKEKVRINNRKWHKKNKKYWNEYYYKNRKKLIKRTIEWRKKNKRMKTKKYRCDCCDLEVKEIPKFKKNECPNEIQHFFREIKNEKRRKYRKT